MKIETKFFEIYLEIYDKTNIEQIEKIINNALCDAGIDCSFEIKEDKED